MVMQGKIVYAAREAELVVLVSAGERRTTDGPMLLVDGVVRDTFSGVPPANGHVTIGVRQSGKETPEIAQGRQYLLFLGVTELSASSGAAYRPLVSHSSPMPVPDPQAEEIRSAMREYARIAHEGVAEAEIRQHLIRMLKSPVDFLRVDAARSAPDYSHWTDPEIDALIARVAGADGIKPLSGDVRDNVITTIVFRAASKVATSFAAAQLQAGIVDPVYFGLLLRRDGSAAPILKSLLESPDRMVQIGALRLAGKLGQAAMINKFEERHRSSADKSIHEAIKAARVLLER